MSRLTLRKLACITFLAVLMPAIAIGCSKKTSAKNYKFDFGDGPEQSGYTKVSASLAYSSSTGYGFNTPADMKNVPASGAGVASDAVQFLKFGTKSPNTFNVDLPKGLYEVSVTLGDTSRASIAAEGVFQIINMTGNNAVDKFLIPVTDGQLNLLVTEGKAGTNFTISALEISKVSDSAKSRQQYISAVILLCAITTLWTQANKPDGASYCRTL